LESAFIDCPYCGEELELLIDCSVPRQEYVEDCAVCCKPIVVTVTSSEGCVESITGRCEND